VLCRNILKLKLVSCLFVMPISLDELKTALILAICAEAGRVDD
jgi:hypothetical protein